VLKSHVYPLLPASLQSVAASLRGYQLQSLRYGGDLEKRVAEALDRDTWDRERLRRWQEERLARILHSAVTRVPYYREHWAERRRKGDRASAEVLENWPILSKEAVRANPRAFLADGCDPKNLVEAQTSGTTGTPLRVWHSRDQLRSWYGNFEARIRRWNGLDLRERWAHMGGQRVTAGNRRRPPYWVWNRGMHQLYMSTYHISPAVAASYVEALRKYRIRYLFGYASAMLALAKPILDQGLDAPRMAVVISNAEPFFGFQRAALARAFDCPVRDTYGQAEIVCGASECPSGSMHLWPEVSVVEWWEDGAERPSVNGRSGRMITTALLNPDMPLIRYDGGDRSTPAPPGERCACGRTLPVIRSIDGRTADLLLTPEGTPMGGLDTIFDADLPMREAQIVQETLHRICIKVVPAPGFGSKHSERMIRGVRTRIGDNVEVVVQMVDAIPRTAAGKFPVQLSLISRGDPQAGS
jgi:phenylacetate-CoA ligase